MPDITIQIIGVTLIVVLSVSVVLTALHYPSDTDAPHRAKAATAQEYYRDAYNREHSTDQERFAENEEYVLMARAHAAAAGIPHMVESFVERCRVGDGRALEVGAGSGLLQDAVERYVGMDLSTTARRFFRKPFVAASATNIPFRDDQFDAVWSIWVLEHIENPEQALREIRRVVKDGGHILLRPAWNCDPWGADGYEIRPYRDLNLKGKLVKASIPLRTSRWYILFYARTVRLIRTLTTRLSGQPATLHFIRLQPNYNKYWVTDSDAVVSIDFFEVALWFTSRGDDCINCPSLRTLMFGLPGQRPEALIIRVNKQRDRRYVRAAETEARIHQVET